MKLTFHYGALLFFLFFLFSSSKLCARSLATEQGQNRKLDTVSGEDFVLELEGGQSLKINRIDLMPMDNKSTLKLAHTVKEHSNMGEGWSLAWNPASGVKGLPLTLAFCGSKSKVRVWDIYSPTIWKPRFEGQRYSRRSCAWSPCGQLLAATSIQDNTSIFKNKRNQAIELLSFYGAHSFKGEMKMNSVCWSASGSFLATCGSRDNSICIWRIVIAHIASKPLLAHTGSALAAFASYQEGCSYKQLMHENCASRSRLPSNRLPICVWNIETVNDDDLELVAYLQGHSRDVNFVQWHPKVDALFSGSSDHTIKVWIDKDPDGGNNWRCVQTLGQPQNGHDSPVWSLSFNAAGDKMVTSSDDGTLKVWKTENVEVRPGNIFAFAHWSHVYTLTGCHDGAIFSVHWSREGIIATGGADGKIGLFAENNESQVDGPLYKLLLKEKTHVKKVNSVQWSPGENQLLASTSADETIKVWELEQANEEVHIQKKMKMT